MNGIYRKIKNFYQNLNFSDKTKYFRFDYLKFIAASGFPVFLSLCFLPANVLAQSSIKTIETDLDRDGRTEKIVLRTGDSQTLQIRRGKKLLWRGVPARWKPWKLEIADVDGDGRGEIIVGVFKATKFFPKPHNCLFIYGFSGDRAFPKWLGSSLSKPFTDFTFDDSNTEKGVRLFALETTLEGKKSLGIYRWNGFGFTLERRQGEWQSARILRAKNGKISMEADGKEIFIAKDLTR